MASFHQATQIFSANQNHRRRSEEKAGDLWRDVVFDRMKARALSPLGEEETTFLQYVREHDMQLQAALQILERSGL